MSDQWHYIQAGQTYGPATLQQMRDLIAAGMVKPGDTASDNPAAAFMRVDSFPELYPQGPLAGEAPLAARPADATGTEPVSYRTHSGELPFSAAALDSLRRTRPWVMFLGILAYVGAGVIVVGSLFMAFGMSMARGARGGPNMSGLGLLVALYLAFAVVYVVVGVYLTRYASCINRVVATRYVTDLEAAMEIQRSFWKFMGILAIVIMVLYCVVIAGVMVFAGFAARGIR